MAIIMLVFLVYDKISGTGAAKAELIHSVMDNTQDIEVLQVDVKETKTQMNKQTLILQRLDINQQYQMRKQGIRHKK